MWGSCGLALWTSTPTNSRYTGPGRYIEAHLYRSSRDTSDGARSARRSWGKDQRVGCCLGAAWNQPLPSHCSWVSTLQSVSAKDAVTGSEAFKSGLRSAGSTQGTPVAGFAMRSRTMDPESYEGRGPLSPLCCSGSMLGVHSVWTRVGRHIARAVDHS